MTASIGDVALVIAILLFGIGLYFLPTIIASGRHHHQATAIFILNLLAGWTFIGWVGATVWAFTATPGDVGARRPDDIWRKD